MKNGSIGLFDYLKGKLVFKTEPSHCETIFDMQIQPNSFNTMATCSFEGTLKIWDLTTLKIKDSFSLYTANEDAKQGETEFKTILYSLAWSPKDNQVAVSNGAGMIQIWDIDKGKQVCVYQSPSKTPIYKLDWHPMEKEYILFGTSKGDIIILKVVNSSEGLKMETYRKFSCSEIIYGVQWNPTNKDCFAVGCNDGVLRIYDMSKKEDEVVKQYKGHTSKIFNVNWHPHFSHVLATSSDDKTVRVWDLKAVRR
jgi:WD repeat-containing protein 17